MNSYSKLRKIASNGEDDRLRKLPEAIIFHILSLMPTKDAARTSVLSKMWRHLFLAVPVIDIIDSRMKHALVHFINRRLMLCRTDTITSFRLRCRMLPGCHDLVHSWLAALLFRNLRVLDIKLCSRRIAGIRRYPLSKLHLAWESLEVLKLHGDQFCFKLPETVMFPKLKVLHLKSMKLSLPYGVSPPYRFSDELFPQLEDLRLERLLFAGDWPLLYISLSNLKRLAVATIAPELEVIDIHSPQLQHLELQIPGGTDSGTRVSMCNLASVISVYFVQWEPEGHWFRKLFCKVNSVTELDLSGWAAEGLEDCVPLPVFPNLIYLKIGTPAKRSLWNVLLHSPNLEALDIHDCIQPALPEHTFESCCPHPEIVPQCFGRRLTEICIRAFGETEPEIEAVGFILQHAVVLQSVMLHCNNDRWTFWTSKRLLKLKRRSPNCEIELV